MHAQRGQNSSFRLLESPRAALNKSALGILTGGLATAILAGAASMLFENKLFSLAGTLIGAVIVFYAVNATGYLLMCDARTTTPTMGKRVTALQALRWSIRHGHSLISVFLLVLIGIAASATIAGLILALCKLPSIGTTLYAFVFPAMIVLFGALSLGAIVILLLAAPAIWSGTGAIYTVRHLMRMLRRDWPAALGQLGLLFLLLIGICALVLIVLGLGSIIAGSLSRAILFSAVDMLLTADGGFELAGNIGTGVAWGLGSLFPLLVLMAGLCRINLYTLAWFDKTA